MKLLFLSPGFPVEMPFFVRALADAGARVVGLGEQPEGLLPPMARQALEDYHQVRSLWDEEALIAQVRGLGANLERVECLWEPGVILAAKLREALGLPGMTVDQTMPFRDKERMKQVLDAAGIRTPRHARCDSDESCREAAERIGFPLIVKPIAGAGSADTHRVDGPEDLERVLPGIQHVGPVSVEEFIQGEEFTFDSVCAGGKLLFHNVSWYRPQPLIGRTVEWISPQTLSLREPDQPRLGPGTQMGRAVLEALRFDTGFTHMEWFLDDAGEAVFGEIAARPPGALSVDVMNVSSGLDTFRSWAEAVCQGKLTRQPERRYNAAVIFKRAQGTGRIRAITGLERLVARYRSSIVDIDLLPPGSPRRDWKRTLLSDGHVMVRHPDLAATMEIADRIGTDLQMYAS